MREDLRSNDYWHNYIMSFAMKEGNREWLHRLPSPTPDCRLHYEVQYGISVQQQLEMEEAIMTRPFPMRLDLTHHLTLNELQFSILHVDMNLTIPVRSDIKKYLSGIKGAGTKHERFNKQLDVLTAGV